MAELFFNQFFTTRILIKAFLILFLIFYFFFSVLLIRQVQIMTAALQTDINQILKLAAFVNLAISIIILAFTVFA